MKTIVVIPARYASTRLPAKPLLRESGQYLIEHVYKACLLSKLADEILVATDDQRIYDAVLSFGGKVEMTSVHHKSGSDRVAEVARKHEGDLFINVQGDEPEISPNAIDQVISLLSQNPSVDVATLASVISPEEAKNPHWVKVVRAHNGHALYFSRSPIPYLYPDQTNVTYLGHIGIYGYRRNFLLQYPSLPPSQLEAIEKLEQLRILENGYSILVGITDYRAKGIDTREDYEKFLARIRSTRM